MPGNGLEDRVHNFFAQDSSFLGQHHSQAMEGNWTVPNSNFWAGSQRQDNSANFNSITYNSQNSDTDRGVGSYPHHVTQDLNFTQSNRRPDFANSQSPSEQLNSNGFMHEKHQRENDANFLGVDGNSNQCHFITSKGSSVQELQQSGGLDHLTRVSVRQDTSESPVNFDLFGGQQQRSHQQSSIQPALQRPQSGVSNMQQLQQQLMIRKMQELHRQQQLQHLDMRLHNSNNEVTPFAKPTCSNQPSFIYGNPNSNTPQYPWVAESGTNWMNRGPPTLQGSSSVQSFPPNLGQAQQLVNLVPQQADQSPYGVPISSSKGLPGNQYPQMVTARSSMLQMPVSSNHLQGNELNFMADQVSLQSEPSISRHKFLKENMFGLGSGMNTEMRNMGGFQQVNSLSRSGLQWEFVGRQEVAVQLETSHEKLRGQVASPQNEVALDPDEEKILFSSDVNIWDAFGTEPPMSREAGDAIDIGGLSNGLPSMQSGSWSALMQSAVAETSSSNVMSPEEWSGLILHKNDDLLRGQPPLTHNGSTIQQTSSADQNIRINSALNSVSFPPVNDITTANAMGLNQFGKKFQNGPDQTLRTKTSTKANSPIWMTGHTGAGLQSNGWIPQAAAVPPHGDRVAITHDAEKLQQNFRNSEVKAMQRDMVHGSSLWNSNSVPSTSDGSGHVNSRVGNHENQGVLSSKEIRWYNAHPPARSQDGRSLGRLLHQANDLNHILESTNSREKGDVRRNEMENCDGRENSNDSHRSNISQHTSGACRESGPSDVSDSQTFPTGKQKSANQLSRKVSASRKFQYHPTKQNEDEDADAERTYRLKQSAHIQVNMSQQDAHFGQSKIFGQTPKNAIGTEKGQSSELHRDNVDINAKEPSHGNLSGHTSNVPLASSQTTDAQSSSNASFSSQNMLELLHKVDQSRNHGAIMQFKSSEYNSSSQQPDAECSDGFGHFQHSQSHVSQGFGLQLGPPSQKLRVLDRSVVSQNDQDTLSSSTAAAVGMGDKAQQMVPSRSVQSLPSAEEAQVDFSLSRSTTSGLGSNNSSLYKTPESFLSELHSGIPHSQSTIQSQQIARVSGQMQLLPHIDSFGGNVAQRRSSNTLLPDASSSFRQDNLASSAGMYRQSHPDEQERLQTDSAPRSDHERTSQQFAMPGISLPGNSAQGNMWTDVPKLQNNVGIQFQQVSSRIPESPLPSIVESSSVSLMQGYENSQEIANGEEQRLRESSGQPVAFLNREKVTKMFNSLEKVPCMKRLSDGSPSSSAEQNDMNVFGQSLKPNSISHQDHLSHSHVEVLKDRETDSGDRASKRMRATDNIVDVQQGAVSAGEHDGHNAVIGGSLGSRPGLQTEDGKTLGFSRPLDILHRKVLHQGDEASNDSLALNRDVPQSFPCSDHTPVRTDHLQVSPLMVSSWLSQYRTSSNEKMLQINGAHHLTTIKPEESPFAKTSSDLEPVNPEDKVTAVSSDVSQINSSHQTSSLGANGRFTSLWSPQLNITVQPQVVLRPKKRTEASPEAHPWHKVILQDSQDLWSLSMTEADWNEAAGHLTEKVEDDAELMEDGPPVLRSKRRLILTTLLMQQLLRPATANVTCSDASRSYDILAYCVSRIALGDACSMASRSSILGLSCDNSDLIRAKDKSLKRTGCSGHGKVTEELTERARRLENDLLRLDKSASISGLRVDCQELEKFSIINRFAKFHGRGQHDSAETASIDVNAKMQRSLPQRYVTVIAMPKTLSENVQCLSLQ